MREYRTSEEIQKESKKFKDPENLLEQVLSDAKPVVDSTTNAKYDIASRPTELSSGGYVDITD